MIAISSRFLTKTEGGQVVGSPFVDALGECLGNQNGKKTSRIQTGSLIQNASVWNEGLQVGYTTAPLYFFIVLLLSL